MYLQLTLSLGIGFQEPAAIFETSLHTHRAATRRLRIQFSRAAAALTQQAPFTLRREPRRAEDRQNGKRASWAVSG